MKSLIALFLVVTLFVVAAVSASETMKGAQKDYQVFKAEMSAKLDSVEKEIVELKVKAKQKGSTAKEATIKELEETRDKLKTELNEMESKGNDNWKKFKKGFASSMDNLNTKIQKALKD